MRWIAAAAVTVASVLAARGWVRHRAVVRWLEDVRDGVAVTHARAGWGPRAICGLFQPYGGWDADDPTCPLCGFVIEHFTPEPVAD